MTLNIEERKTTMTLNIEERKTTMKIRYYFDGEVGDPIVARAVQLVMVEGLSVAMKIITIPRWLAEKDSSTAKQEPIEEGCKMVALAAERAEAQRLTPQKKKVMKVDGKGVLEHFRAWVGTKDTHSWSALKVHFQRLGFSGTTIPSFFSKLDILGIAVRRGDVMLVDLGRLERLKQSDFKGVKRGKESHEH